MEVIVNLLSVKVKKFENVEAVTYKLVNGILYLDIDGTLINASTVASVSYHTSKPKLDLNTVYIW